HSADLLDLLRGVAAEVALEELEDAAGVLEVHVHLRWVAVLERAALGAVGALAEDRALLALAAGGEDVHPRVLPRLDVIGVRLRVPAAEQPAEVLGGGELAGDDRGRVGVVLDVLAELAAVREDVVDDPAEEGDVGAGAERNVEVGDGARPREAGIDVDDLRAPLLRLHHPLEADRMALGHVRPLDDDAVGVLQVLLEGGGATPTEA